jgi:outer membrane immunogenic protein
LCVSEAVMKKLATYVIAVAGLIGSPALAADMAVKAPPPPPAPAPVDSWTGFYAGLNAGGGWENTIYNSASLGTCSIPTLGGCAAVSSVINAAVPGQFNTRPSGFIGGGQIGYNYQAGAFVWGIETDFQGANIKGDASAASAVGIPNSTLAIAGTGSQEIDWFGTLRGRLGWLPANPLLVYATTRRNSSSNIAPRKRHQERILKLASTPASARISPTATTRPDRWMRQAHLAASRRGGGC